MRRAQIQLPDDMYEQVQRICRLREISMAELGRRGFEYMLSVYSQGGMIPGDWTPPKPRRLGWKGLSDADIKAHAQGLDAEPAIAERRKR
jgi:hypothetical protein